MVNPILLMRSLCMCVKDWKGTLEVHTPRTKRAVCELSVSIMQNILSLQLFPRGKGEEACLGNRRCTV